MMNRSTARAAATTLATMALVAGAAGTASAGEGDEWSTFGSADWQSQSGFQSQHGLVTTSTSAGTFGGVELVDAGGLLSEVGTLSFDFRADQTGPSGGSPRLVLQLDDGGRIEVRPIAWTADEWTHVDGSQSGSVDSHGGSCGFQYGGDLASATACHAGASVTDAFLVNDSGWLGADGDETVVVDNITVGDAFVGGPGNSN